MESNLQRKAQLSDPVPHGGGLAASPCSESDHVSAIVWRKAVPQFIRGWFTRLLKRVNDSIRFFKLRFEILNLKFTVFKLRFEFFYLKLKFCYQDLKLKYLSFKIRSAHKEINRLYEEGY